MAFKRLILAGLSLIIFQQSVAQVLPETKIAASLLYHRGFLVAHRPSVVPLQQEKINGLECNILLRTDGSQNWQKSYSYPEIGISLTYWDLGNQKQLGFGVSAIPYVDFPLFHKKNHSFDLKFGWGIGYVEKTFNADNNYKNVAIGSHLNCALVLQVRYKINLTEKLNLTTGLSLSHFSNGSTATPNLGLNLATITGGIAYGLGKTREIKDPELPVFKKSTRITIFGSGSWKQVYPAEGKTYFASTLSGNITRQKNRINGIGAGVDIFYDESINKKAEEQNVTLNSPLETLRVGIHASYELVMSDLSLMISLGGYAYTKLDSDGYIYQRIAIRYMVSKKVFACINLKTHWGKADFIEWGVGYRIDYKK